MRFHPAEEGFLADARKRHDELAADLEEVSWRCAGTKKAAWETAVCCFRVALAGRLVEG